MSAVNQATIVGNVGGDPEIRALTGGQQVASFSIATSESWRDKHTGEKKEATEWHRVAVFGDGLVGVIEKYVRKGSKLFLQGKLRTRKWQAQDGSDRYTTEIVLSGPGAQLVLLDRAERAPPPSEAAYGARPAGGDGSAYRAAKGSQPLPAPARNDPNDEIPF